MRRKAPENILLGTDLPDVQTVGIQVVDLSECPVLNQLLQFQDRRMIPENMPNHKDSVLCGGQVDEVLPLLYVNGERLLDENVLSGFESRLRHFVVCRRRRGQGDGRNRRIAKDDAEIPAESDTLVFVSTALLNRSFPITEHCQGAKLVKVSGEVLAPVTNSNNSDVDLRVTEWIAVHRGNPSS